MDRGFPGGAWTALSFAYDYAHTDHVFAPEQLRRLGALCKVLSFDPIRRFDHPGVRDNLARTEILITGSGAPRIDAAALALMPRLRLIAHASGTVKNLVDPAVFEQGIIVTNAAIANAVPVAEFTVAKILLANKQVSRFRNLYREERSGLRLLPTEAADLGNYDKTVGIIGASHVGRKTIELLQPFDLHVMLYDPYVGEAEAQAMGVELVELDELMARADVASLHAPNLPSTAQMIDSRRLALLRDGATFINTSRGNLVDEEALTRELVSGRISAVIDIEEPQALREDSPLYELPNVVLTPNMSGALGSERERLGTLVVNEVERFVRGERLLHTVDRKLLYRLA
jgi:phosphoglycerate dehydrogenase-like enzyme